MTKTSASKLDAVYRSILLTKFFTKGWGKPENLRRLFEFRKVVSNRDECFKLIERDYPVTITKEQTLTDCKLYEGYFISPLEKYLPGIVPEIAQKAHFQALLPIHWPQPGVKPMCLHLAGTGDHFFWRRRNLMVKPLLKEAGIGGIILENPFYGLRKPTDQVRSSLHNVSDIFVMGGCLILEALVLFNWCERNGLGPLGVTGLSMGGHMASLAATNWPKPLVLVPCLSWSTASAVFLQGVMSHSINWDLLEDQYLSDGVYREKLSKMVTIIDEAFLAGKKFARTYSETVHKKEAKSKENSKPNTKDEQPADPENIANEKGVEVKGNNANSKKNEGSSSASTIHITQAKIDENQHIVIGNEIIDFNKNSLELENIPKNVEKPPMFAEMENLHKELKKMLDNRKITTDLYNKLTTNKKFELEPKDIEIINQVNEGIINDLLLKCQSVQTTDDKKGPGSQSRPSDSEDQPPKGPTSSQQTNIQQEKSPPNDKQHPTPHNSALAVAESNIQKTWNVADMTSDLFFWPFVRGSGKKIDITKIHWRDREALQFMRGIMDECTHLSNFSVPFDTSLIIAVCAKHDAYVPREDVGTLEEIWPGAEVRYVDAGHVSAYILHQSLFRSCIKEAFERSKKRWKDGKHIDEPPAT